MNKSEAVNEFVNRDFSFIDESMVKDMIEAGVGNFEDITPYDPDDEDDYPPEDYVYGLPMWGTMFSPNTFEDEWIRDHLQETKDCGFTIFDSDYGIFLGIDGCGYDFYESHWTPLYDAMGMRWHTDEETA
jgi:hypothetical protein